ncbi:hypothetical protein E2C01_079180 [Portunus trituberculatus]|uniref:Uncharacterized protein n=1 Tax=Portunus trituberculatus TaxID=210409 RepID=A0A5B7IKU3_PORTR|nr:hypothetical protein [Portunus trituberculatus]
MFDWRRSSKTQWCFCATVLRYYAHIITELKASLESLQGSKQQAVEACEQQRLVAKSPASRHKIHGSAEE